jgi:hypothetical protein
MLADFKQAREASRSTALRHARTEHARRKAKPTFVVTLEDERPRSSKTALPFPKQVLDEAKTLIASPPYSSARDSYVSDLRDVTNGAREVLLVDLPRKPHRRSALLDFPKRGGVLTLRRSTALSSSYEIVTLPKVVALTDSTGPRELGSHQEAVDDDWERVDDFFESKISYAEVARGV